MSKDPAVLFYTSDFLTGTAFFTDVERGQYIRLLCEQHQNGHIPENHLKTICFSLGSPVAKKFIKDENGNYYNKRMEEEIIKRRDFTESRRLNGMLGGRPKASGKPSGLPSDEPSKNLIGNENEIINVFNELTGKKIRVFDGKAKRQFNERIREGFTIEDIRTAIINCMNDPYHKENPQYLTLEFITRADKLQKYLNSGVPSLKKYTYTEIQGMINKGLARSTNDFRRIESRENGNQPYWVTVADYEKYNLNNLIPNKSHE